MRVLVAEDEQTLADLVATGLRDHAMAVDVVYDGLAAQQRLVVNEYDVLVLDRDLPGVHGDRICRELAQGGARTRILILTAAGSLSDRVGGLHLGADDYLPKPFEYEELVPRRRPGGPHHPAPVRRPRSAGRRIHGRTGLLPPSPRRSSRPSTIRRHSIYRTEPLTGRRCPPAMSVGPGGRPHRAHSVSRRTRSMPNLGCCASR
ncbi:response regulator [Streptomyces goshikiensis]|uniref:response regulator n=1 Tax=Streptomyces goshikiensis TaxID=1942 RepID=UPI00399445B7